MRIELENALANKFPFMRVERVWAEDEPRWYPVYTDCGDGWYPLIRDMCREIRDLYASLGIAPDLRVTQVRSGYRGLSYTVYFTPAALEEGAPSCRRQAMEILERYARMAAGVCEHCGRPGEPREGELYERVLCDSCFERKLKQADKERGWRMAPDRLGTDFPFFRYYKEDDPDKTGRWYAFPRGCDNGWYYLIYDMARKVDAVYREAGLEPDLEPDMIYEKYGMLRVDMYGDDRYDDAAELKDTLKVVRGKAYKTIARYEDMSEHVCEACGAPGEYRSDLGWIQSLCDRCYQKSLKSREDAKPAGKLARELADRYTFAVNGERQYHWPVPVGCGPGWHRLIWDLCRDIAELYEAAGVEPDLRLQHIRQRYGALRLEYSFSGEGQEPLRQAVEERILRAERESEHICEECGDYGRLREDLPLAQTLCDRCHELKKAGKPDRRRVQKDEFESELEKKYPFLSACPGEGFACMSTHRVFIDCGSGWYDLIRESCQEVAELYEAEGRQTDLWISWMTETGGALKIEGYWDNREVDGDRELAAIHEKTEEILSRCQRRSKEICEFCGEPGQLREEYIRPRTLCDSCYAKEAGISDGIPVPDDEPF